jgi:hypothetical protein
MEHDDSIGTSNYPSVWNQQPREGMQLHWDGNNYGTNLSAEEKEAIVEYMKKL